MTTLKSTASQPLTIKQELLHTPLRPHAHLLPTLFDRLKDDAPHRKTELAGDFTISHKQLREIVQRDLIFLLNTTSLDSDMDLNSYPEVISSVLNYGIPALAGSYMHGHKWADLEKAIRRAILRFEPRLDPEGLMITPLMKDQSEQNYNVLLFEICGKILTKPYPTAFIVQSAFDLETNRIQSIAR